MSLIRYCARLWRNIRHRASVEDDLQDELRAYMDLAADQHAAKGMSDSEARRAVRVEAGGMEPVKEAVRDVRAGSWLELAWRDFHFGGRLLARNPGFTAVAFLMLAVGIGANTAIFSVLHALVLRGLPYSEPERIVMVYEKRPLEKNMRNIVSAPDYLDWREQSTSFESLAATSHSEMTWQAEGGAERLPVALVTAELLDVYGVRPVIGSGFPREGGSPFSAVLTHRFWQRRFGADPAVVGRTMTINDTALTIVGVLPEAFEYPERDVEVLVPLQWRSREKLDRSSHEYLVAGRLKRGVPVRAAQAEMDGIGGRLESQYAENKGHGANVVPLADVLLGPIQFPLFALQAAAGLLLLVACGSLANLLLARTLARERELSIRLAIGAGRGQLFRQLLCESLLLSIGGGVLGIAVAFGAAPLFQYLAPPDTVAVGVGRIGIDSTVLGAALGLTLLCTLVFGLVPAWRGVGSGWKSGSAGTSNRQAAHKFLIAVQVTFSIVLLTATVMFLRSFAALRTVDPGFRADGVLTMQISIPGNRYRDAARVLQFTEEWSDSIRRMPGVQAVGLTSHLPVSGMDGRRGLAIQGVDPPDPNQPRRAHPRWVSPSYFEAMGMRIVQGRAFQDTDRAASRPVMMVNEAAARRYFPDGKAVGHMARPGGSNGPWHEVVGVVANVRHWGLEVEPNPEQYFCHLQQPTWNVNMVVRGSGDLNSLVPSIRQELWRAGDSGIPLARVQTMAEWVDRSIQSERSILILLAIFGGTALVLTAAGIWGTAAFLLSQRKRELGIRLALGATEGVLTGQVVRGAMRAVAGGAVVGIALSILAARATSATLFGVNKADPSTYAGVLVVCCGVAWLANYVPARRILREAPYDVIRQE